MSIYDRCCLFIEEVVDKPSKLEKGGTLLIPTQSKQKHKGTCLMRLLIVLFLVDPLPSFIKAFPGFGLILNLRFTSIIGHLLLLHA